jgi:hypothetical protein
MFDQFTGLPLHVLVIHAVVVFVPLTVLTALVFALGPRWRWVLRWPLAAAAVVAFGSTLVARLSGQAFFNRLGEPAHVEEHASRGLLLTWIVLAFAVVALIASFALAGPTPIRGAIEREGLARPVQIVVAAILVVAALAAGVQVIRTGDAGARAVWGTGEG